MSLGASYEHTEREPSRLALSTEANCNPVGEGEQISAIVTPDSAHQALQDPASLNEAAKAAFRQYWISGGQVIHLDRAVEYWYEAIRLTSLDSPERSRYLNNLGIGLHERYACAGNLTDLEDAITAFRQAVEATPANSSDWPARLNNLGNALLKRYARTGNLTDLEDAIRIHQQAVKATPVNSLDRPRYLSNLGIGLHNRYAHTGDLNDLKKIILTFRKAVEATTPNSLGLPARLSNLGNGLRDLYARTGDLTNLEDAIRVHQQALQAIPTNSPDQPMYLNNLGIALRDHYAHTGDLTNLKDAIAAFQQAVQAAPTDSPNWPRYLNNLGAGLHNHYARTGNLTDLEAAISAWERSWSIPHTRFAAFPVTYQLGQQRWGVRIAAHLVAAYLEQARRRHPRSASVPPRVLEIAEGSKSRLLTQMVGRGPLPLPSGLSSEVVAQEQQLLTELTALDTRELTIHDHLIPTQDEASHLQRLQQRQATLHELEDLWTRIAHLGLEGAEYVALRCGAALTWQEFKGLTKALGPTTALLSFFTTADQALLFLLRAGWRVPRVFEEPLDQNSWADIMDRFFREVHYYDPNLRLNETWDQPLHALLSKVQRHLKGVERLILAPAGNGHLLPWAVLTEHAGWHTASGQPIPLVILPALSILPRLRKSQPVPPGSVLVVGDPRGDLHHAKDEARKVAKRFETEPLLGTAATKSEVLVRLPSAKLIHLATHAFFEPKNPLESGIELADGVLTAREVLQHRLQADLLVLSACESGQVGSLGGEELAGLSQAFLQAGVRSLLVSLWKVDDPATAAFMQAFYTQWQERGADKALALRQAMTQIQRDPQNAYWSDPYYWGAFVLVGDWRLTVEDSIDKGEDICG